MRTSFLLFIYKLKTDTLSLRQCNVQLRIVRRGLRDRPDIRVVRSCCSKLSDGFEKSPRFNAPGKRGLYYELHAERGACAVSD